MGRKRSNSSLSEVGKEFGEAHSAQTCHSMFLHVVVQLLMALPALPRDHLWCGSTCRPIWAARAPIQACPKSEKSSGKHTVHKHVYGHVCCCVLVNVYVTHASVHVHAAVELDVDVDVHAHVYLYVYMYL